MGYLIIHQLRLDLLSYVINHMSKGHSGWNERSSRYNNSSLLEVKDKLFNKAKPAKILNNILTDSSAFAISKEWNLCLLFKLWGLPNANNHKQTRLISKWGTVHASGCFLYLVLMDRTKPCGFFMWVKILFLFWVPVYNFKKGPLERNMHQLIVYFIALWFHPCKVGSRGQTSWWRPPQTTTW